jgi:thiamine biosynthesis lipoprotein
VIEVSIAEMIVPDLHRRGAKVLTRDRRTDVNSDSVGWTSTWSAWGTTATVSVTDPAALPAATRLVARHFAAAEKAAARFRRDAELHRLYRAGGRPITVSPLLAELIAAALSAAERTDGDVDPTVSAAMTAVHGRTRRDRDGTAMPVCGTRSTGSSRVPGWQRVDLQGRRLQVPAGTTLDLSATATSLTCDRAAAAVRARLAVGVLVTLGGDAASAGPGPEAGWHVSVDDRGSANPIEVLLPAGAALATSHFAARLSPVADAGSTAPSGHLIDPRTGQAPTAVWRMATAIGFTSLEASTYTAATLIRGVSARAWLTQLWVPARLVTIHDDVITVGPWGSHQAGPTSVISPTNLTINTKAFAEEQISPSSAAPTGNADGPSRFPTPRLANPRRTTR